MRRMRRTRFWYISEAQVEATPPSEFPTRAGNWAVDSVAQSASVFLGPWVPAAEPRGGQSEHSGRSLWGKELSLCPTGEGW